MQVSRRNPLWPSTQPIGFCLTTFVQSFPAIPTCVSPTRPFGSLRGYSIRRRDSLGQGRDHVHSYPMASSLPPPRRIVASNLPIDNAASKFTEPAIEVLDETLAPVPIFGAGLQRTAVATIPTVPASNDGS